MFKVRESKKNLFQPRGGGTGLCGAHHGAPTGLNRVEGGRGAYKHGAPPELGPASEPPKTPARRRRDAGAPRTPHFF